MGTPGRQRIRRRHPPRARAGVNWIDTAAIYGLGHSEEIVARALKEWSGPRPTSLPSAPSLASRSHHLALTECQILARRTGSPCAGSRSRPSTSTRSTGRTRMRRSKRVGKPSPRFREEGKVRWIGVSNFNLDQLKRARKIAPSPACSRPIPCCGAPLKQKSCPSPRKGIGVINYSPMVSDC